MDNINNTSHYTVSLQQQSIVTDNK